MVRMKEEHIKRRIALAQQNQIDELKKPETNYFNYHYWYAYANALRLVVRMPPDDKVAPEYEYDDNKTLPKDFKPKSIKEIIALLEVRFLGMFDDENRFHITSELYNDAIREIIETLELYMEDHPEP